jgi:hypothetical protein
MEAFRIYLITRFHNSLPVTYHSGETAAFYTNASPKVAQPTQSLSFVVLYQSAVRI